MIEELNFFTSDICAFFNSERKKILKQLNMIIKTISHLNETRIMVLFFVLYIGFCIVMELRLYYRMEYYAIRPIKNDLEYKSSIPCDLNPFCVVTVKGLMLDYLNFYILGPLAALIDKIIKLSQWKWLSPNYISILHVFVAIGAGKLISSNSLQQRRLGVLVFQTRSWLDDLDGFVARERKHITGEHSDVGTSGYYMDALCDSLGTIALLLGILYYLKTNVPSRGEYVRLQPHVISIEDAPEGSCVTQKKKVRQRCVLPTVLLISGTLVTSSIAWNRYIALYQNLLESDNANLAIGLDEIYKRQTDIFRSNSFRIIATFWRIINPHALTDYILVAIFIDYLWEYLHYVRWIIYVIIFVLAYFSDFHYIESFGHVWDISSPAVSDNMLFNQTNV